MAFSTGTITVITSATSIIVSNTSQKSRTLKNTGSETVYVGSDNSITISTAFPVHVGDEFEFGDYNGVLYGIVETTSTTVEFIEDQ